MFKLYSRPVRKWVHKGAQSVDKTRWEIILAGIVEAWMILLKLLCEPSKIWRIQSATLEIRLIPDEIFCRRIKQDILLLLHTNVICNLLFSLLERVNFKFVTLYLWSWFSNKCSILVAQIILTWPISLHMSIKLQIICVNLLYVAQKNLHTSSITVFSSLAYSHALIIPQIQNQPL